MHDTKRGTKLPIPLAFPTSLLYDGYGEVDPQRTGMRFRKKTELEVVGRLGEEQPIRLGGDR